MKIKIKLLSMVMVAGQRKFPKDVIEVEKSVAADLIYRKKAIAIHGVEAIKEIKQTVVLSEIELLRKQADDLGIKYPPNIGVAKLKERIGKFIAENSVKPELSVDELKDIALEIGIENIKGLSFEELLDKVQEELKTLFEESGIDYVEEMPIKEKVDILKKYLENN